MKPTREALALLKAIGRIERMERGTICQMKGREHFNHQTWQNGRNRVRYVPRDQIEDLQAAIAGYARFQALAQQYADEIIRMTRLEHDRKHPKRSRRGAADRKKPVDGPD
jgi:hypothetical protein